MQIYLIPFIFKGAQNAKQKSSQTFKDFMVVNHDFSKKKMMPK
jgi:hypothetical protein